MGDWKSPSKHPTSAPKRKVQFPKKKREKTKQSKETKKGDFQKTTNYIL